MSHITFTDEQRAIIDFEGPRLVVKAFAGTGKTFTMLHFTLARPHLKFLYLAFNRSVRDEAESKFPKKNVDCMTYNQLCYRQCGKRYRHKLVESLRIGDVADILGLRNLIEARDVISTIDAFCNSGDDVLDLDHFRSRASRPSQRYLRNTVANALAYWAQMIDPDNPTPIHHNGYTKVFELSKPDLSQDYDVILYDEGQDCPPSTIKVLGMQPLQLIIIGDDAQSIYLFRNAVNALSAPELSDASCFTLTESFRFGPAIAATANVFLLLRGEQRRVKGLGIEGKVLRPDQFKWSQQRGQVCLLARTVATVLGIALYFSAKGKTVGFVGGFDSYGFDSIEQVFYLHRRDMSKLKGTRLIRDFPTYQQYESFAEQSQDNEMLRTCRIIQDYPFLPHQLAELRNKLHDLSHCDVVVGTVHKSKGLEFPTVYLANDFPDLFDPDSPLSDAELEQEVNLMYVGVTRAQQQLILNESAMEAIKRVCDCSPP